MTERDHESDADAPHLLAVERVLALMRGHLSAALALEDLADEAHLSPFYFSRVFRQLTGSPPGEFLGALRLDAARRLLLTTPLSVAEVCYEVGYTSLGSFTTRFGQHVGLPPAALRRLATEFEPARLVSLAGGLTQRPILGGAVVGGRISSPLARRGVVCVGLFPRAIPQGMPVACTQVAGDGPFRIAGVPDGTYSLLAAALPWSDDPLAYLAPGRGLLVGMRRTPLVVRGGQAEPGVELALRPPATTDPPVVAALPLLLARWLGRAREEHPCEDRKIEEAPAAAAC